MKANAYTYHPDDPGTLLVKDWRLVPDLMAKADAHTVIWQRNLGTTYRDIFDEHARAQFKTLKSHLNFQLTFDGEKNFLRKIFSDSASLRENRSSKIMKSIMPGFLWSDAVLMARLVSKISGDPTVNFVPLMNDPGGKPSNDRNSRWHRDTGVTAHMTLGNEVLELLARNEKAEDSSQDHKIIRPASADVVFFKDALHRKSPKAETDGRFALMAFSK